MHGTHVHSEGRAPILRASLSTVGLDGDSWHAQASASRARSLLFLEKLISLVFECF